MSSAIVMTAQANPAFARIVYRSASALAFVTRNPGTSGSAAGTGRRWCCSMWARYSGVKT
jgi:hypothetical protein